MYTECGKDEDKVPLTLQDCIDKPTKKNFSKPCVIILLIVPIIFYMFYYKEERKPQTHAFFEIFPKKMVDVVTEKVPVMKQIFNVSQPTKEDLEKFKEAQKFMQKHTFDVPVLPKPVLNSENDTARNHSNEHFIPVMPPNGKTRKDTRSCVITHSGNVTLITNANITLNTEKRFPNVMMGGSHTPRKCRAKHQVVIIVPYRDRAEQLSVFLYNIHPFLIQQKLDYRIFVVEQQGKDLFNRGRLLNAGFLETQKIQSRWKCVVFHDVDLLPLDDRILYSCSSVPKHMCGTVSGQENKITSRTLFGGVSAIPSHMFKKVNGFSNLYWGLGGEDNDIFWRFKAVGLGVVKLNKTVARYKSLSTAAHALNPHRYQLLSTATDRFHKDGLNNIHYAVKSYSLRYLYTHVVIDINPRKLNYSENFLDLSRLYNSETYA